MTLSKLINKAVEEWDEKSFKHVGDGGYGTTTDNQYGISIWPDEYDDIKSFLTNCIKESYEAGKQSVIKPRKVNEKDRHETIKVKGAIYHCWFEKPLKEEKKVKLEPPTEGKGIKDCLFQYATKHDVIENTDLITRKEADELVEKYIDDCKDRWDEFDSPELCI